MIITQGTEILLLYSQRCSQVDQVCGVIYLAVIKADFILLCQPVCVRQSVLAIVLQAALCFCKFFQSLIELPAEGSLIQRILLLSNVLLNRCRLNPCTMRLEPQRYAQPHLHSLKAFT